MCIYYINPPFVAGMYADHQDFKQVVFTKRDKARSGPSSAGISKAQKSLMYDFGETPEIKRFGKENGKLVQSARLGRQMTQKQLANQINEREQVVNQYEQGNVVPDQKIVSKLRKVLNIKFI